MNQELDLSRGMRVVKELEKAKWQSGLLGSDKWIMERR